MDSEVDLLSLTHLIFTAFVVWQFCCLLHC